MSRALLLLIGCVFLRAWGVDVISADFSQRRDPPLVKKFGVMDSGLVGQERYARDLSAIGLLGADSLRVDLFIGHEHDAGWGRPIIAGPAPGRLEYAWDDIDLLTRRLGEQRTLPYWSFCYVPRPLQSVPGDWRSPPRDLAAWGTAAEAFTRHFRERKLQAGYYEAYNEPDFSMFWHGTRDQYLALYRATVLGFRRGDPEAVVGGPALAFNTDWIQPFVEMVAKEDLPLDFFSFHSIEDPLGAPPTRVVATDRLRLIAAALDHPRFATTAIHLNEYHPYRVAAEALEQPNDGSALAVRLLDDFAYFLDHPELTLVHWAQFMDAGRGPKEFGLVGFDGGARPAYAAFACYGDLPVERCRLDLPAPLAGFAAADRAQAGVLLWNPGDRPVAATLRLAGLPFAAGHLATVRIVAGAPPLAGFPGSPALVAADAGPDVTGGIGELAVEVPGQGVLYVRIANVAVPAPAAPPGRLVRDHVFYAARSGGQYAAFDRRSWTAHLGMGGATTALVQTAVTLDEVPDALQVSGRIAPAPPAAAVVGLRLDYEVAGRSVAAVFVHGPTAKGVPRSLPWGTRRAAERSVAVADLAACTLAVRAWAPPGWAGRLLLSAIMQDAGPDARADLAFSAAP